MADVSNSIIPVGTTLLCGVVWDESGTIYTAGRDGTLYGVDTTQDTLGPVPFGPKHAARVRVLLAAGGQLLTADAAGTAFVRTLSTQPVQSIPTSVSEVAKIAPPSAYGTGLVVAGVGADLTTWASSAPTTLDKRANLADAGGRLDVLKKVTGTGTDKFRAARTDAGGQRVDLFGLDSPDFTAKGTIRCPKNVILAAAAGDNKFVLVCDDATFRLHTYPEDNAVETMTFAASKPVVQKMARVDKGGILVEAGEDRFAYVLPIKASATVSKSTVGIPDASTNSKIIAITATPDGKRVVALLTETTAGVQRNRVLHALDPTAATSTWQGGADAPYLRATATSLAVSDNGKVAAIVAITVAAAGPKPALQRIDLGTNTSKPVPAEVDGGGVALFSYDDTEHVFFFPGDDDGNSWILLTTNSDGSRWLRKLTLVTGTNKSQSVTIFKGTSSDKLAATPAALFVAGEGTYIASAWADNWILIHLLQIDGTTVVRRGQIHAEGEVSAVALAPGNPPRLAYIVKNGTKGLIHVCNLTGTDSAPVELEQFTTSGDLVSGEPPLGWRGESLIAGTLDSNTKLSVEAFPLTCSAVKTPIAGPGLHVTAASTIVLGSTTIVAVATKDGTANKLDLVETTPGDFVSRASFPTTTAVDIQGIEVLSENDISLLQSNGRVVFFHSPSGLPTPTFAPCLAPWPFAGRKIQWLHRIDVHKLLAGDGRVQTLLIIPDPPTAAGAKIDDAHGRPVRDAVRPALVGTLADPQTVGFEKTSGTLRLTVRSINAGDSGVVTIAVPPTDLPPDAERSITAAAAWTGGTPPIFGVADGRIWAGSGSPTKYGVFPPKAAGEDMVTVMAAGPNPLFAFVIATAPKRVNLRLNTAPGTDLPNTLELDYPVTALAFGPANDFLAAGTAAGTIRVWMVDAAGKTTLVPDDLVVPAEEVQALAIWKSPGATNAGRLAALTRLGRISLWTYAVADGKVTFKSAGPPLSLVPSDSNPPQRKGSLAWAPDGKSLAVASQDGNLFILNTP